MNSKVKKIIAREGLVVVVCVLSIVVSLFLSFVTPEGSVKNLLENLTIIIPYVIYPLYLLARFTIWAAKTLKQK